MGRKWFKLSEEFIARYDGHSNKKYVNFWRRQVAKDFMGSIAAIAASVQTNEGVKTVNLLPSNHEPYMELRTSIIEIMHLQDREEMTKQSCVKDLISEFTVWLKTATEKQRDFLWGRFLLRNDGSVDLEIKKWEPDDWAKEPSTNFRPS